MLGIVLLSIAAAASLAGCQAPRPITGQVSVSLADEEAYRQFWGHSVATVRHFGYEMQRVDPAAGVIVSEPMTSKQWFEFWRNDTLAAGQVVEASMHTTRRQIRVHVQPMGEPKTYLVDVRVDVQRMSQPDRQVTTSASVAHAYTDRLPTEQATTEAEAAVHWVDMGRDRVLETAILERLSRWPDARIIQAPQTEAAETQPATQPADAND